MFELANAVLCVDGPVRTLVGLSLASEYRRGHGALYDAVNHGRIDVVRLRKALARLPLTGSRTAGSSSVDVGPWLRPNESVDTDAALEWALSDGRPGLGKRAAATRPAAAQEPEEPAGSAESELPAAGPASPGGGAGIRGRRNGSGPRSSSWLRLGFRLRGPLDVPVCAAADHLVGAAIRSLSTQPSYRLIRNQMSRTIRLVQARETQIMMYSPLSFSSSVRT